MTKTGLYQKFKEKCGVYSITCSGNNKIYIGSSVDIATRLRAHFYSLRNNKHYNPKLQNSFNKYGESSFSMFILEECSRDSIREVEARWIKEYGADTVGLNISQTTDNTNTGFTHSQETRIKISKNNARYWLGKHLPPHVVEAARQYNTGRKQSPEAIEKRRRALTGRKLSDENKKHIGESNGMLIINLETGVFYTSIREAAAAVGKSRSWMARRLIDVTKNTTMFRRI